ncbi:MAG: pantoate--beta-alanine ligase, partial [Acutalibacteraceae bacterium]|nr:pantoate--beta-alanine ligase [Acutalibacteraceae bacterium]
RAALILSQTIRLGEQMVKDGERDAQKLTAAMKENISKEPLAKIDYVDAVSMDTIEKTDELKGTILVAMAVYIGKTRLIDNFIAEI